MHSISLSNILKSADAPKTIQIMGAVRSVWEFKDGRLIIDQFDKAKCVFLRLKSEHDVELLIDTPYNFEEIESGGYLGTPMANNRPFLWFPDLPRIRRVNDDSCILSEAPLPVYGLSWNSNNDLSVQIRTPENSVTDGLIWQFEEDFPHDEFTSLSPMESQGYFLWGSHGCISKPADLYRHLINGVVFDLRYSWPNNKKCFSENEAHALYTVFSGLEKATGKATYRYFQQQLVLSLIQRQSDDGGWYHGMWTDSSECHYRLHASGVHLLMDEFQRTGCPHVETALQKAAAFLSKTADQLDCGIWFLHDSLELSEQAMSSGPFKWIANKTLGKNVSNMLVLNTHLDTTIALNRYAQLTGDNQYKELVASALAPTCAVLSLKPADWLYKPLFWAIGLTMLPTDKASKLPLPVRAIKRLAAQYLIKKLPDIKARFPRLVMPNGYIDRELSLRTWAIDYQTINLMDLARHAYSFPQAFDETILDKAMEFTQTSGLIKRYREFDPGKRYSVGFWAEALYYRCLAKPDIKYRQWLAEAMLECHDLGFGMAPSLLGSNGEAVSPPEQCTPPIPDNKGILLANLSKANAKELILVNSSNEIITLSWQKTIQPTLRWFNSAGESVTFNDLSINQRDWIRGVDNA